MIEVYNLDNFFFLFLSSRDKNFSLLINLISTFQLPFNFTENKNKVFVEVIIILTITRSRIIFPIRVLYS